MGEERKVWRLESHGGRMRERSCNEVRGELSVGKDETGLERRGCSGRSGWEERVRCGKAKQRNAGEKL